MVVTQHPTHHERGKVANKMIFVAVCYWQLPLHKSPRTLNSVSVTARFSVNELNGMIYSQMCIVVYRPANKQL